MRTRRSTSGSPNGGTCSAATRFREVKYTGWSGFYDLNPEVDLPGHIDENGLATVSQGWFYYADRKRDQLNASISHYADKFGRHELKFGAEFERSKTRDRYGYNDNIFFYDYGGAPYLAYSYGYDISATNVRQSLFVQDSWKMGGRFTANSGLRGDFLQGKNPEVGKVYDSANWAPRLGFAWDVAGDSRSVVKGSYGRYYEGAQTQLFTRAVPGVSDYITYEVNPDYSLGAISDIRPAVLYRVADDIKHPRVDETTLGFERALSTADAVLGDRGLARQQELRQLGRTVGPMAAGDHHHRAGHPADPVQLGQPDRLERGLPDPQREGVPVPGSQRERHRHR